MSTPSLSRWDLSSIYATWAAWHADLRRLSESAQIFEKRRGTLSSGPESLLLAWRDADAIWQLQNKLYRFAQLSRDVDLSNGEVGTSFQRINAAIADSNASMSWFVPEFLKIPEDVIGLWLSTTDELRQYEFPMRDHLRRSKHVLSEELERIMAHAQPLLQAPRRVYEELAMSDIEYAEILLEDKQVAPLTPSNYRRLLETCQSQVDRHNAAKAFLRYYSTNGNTFASLYDGIVRRNCFTAKERRFGSALEASLCDDAISSDVVTSLVESVRSSLKPLHRYFALRKSCLGLKDYHLYDGSLRLSIAPAQSFPFEAACDHILSSLSPLGKNYVSKARSLLQGAHVDPFERPGKRPGAYCASDYSSGAYVLLNYNDSVESVFTLAHEVGHAVHTLLSIEGQPFITSSYSSVIAEVASTTNERLLLQHFLDSDVSKVDRAAFLQRAVDQVAASFFTQIMFADFELQTHKIVENGGVLTKEKLNDVYFGLLHHYYGPEVVVDDFYKWSWARIAHFFTTPFYVYQYATSYAASARVFADLRAPSQADRVAAVDRYLHLLSCGGNGYPADLLRSAGVDLNSPSVGLSVASEMARLADELELSLV